MKGTTAILPTSYFPSISYLKVMNTYAVSLEAHENYQKRTIRNRARILNANGSLLLSVPLQKGKTKTKINHTKISFEEPWKDQHLKHLKSSYGSAPFYEHYIDDISGLIKGSPDTLWSLNLSILDFLKSISYCKSWSISEEYVGTNIYDGLDLRTNNIKSNVLETYHQVFEHKFGFIEDLSCLDLLFNLGPEGVNYL